MAAILKSNEEGGKGQWKGGGAGRREEKTPASKAYEINERPLISRA